MFLSKKHGIYHFFFTDDAGRRHSRSTGAHTKAEALKFVRTYNAEQDAKRRALQHITLDEFRKLYMTHSCSVNTPKTATSNRSALNELCRFVGAGTILSKITTADCERFLAKKTVDASLWTARKYYLALGAMFERAKTWGHLMENPWRKVKKPRVPQVVPAYFTRQQFRDLMAQIDNRDLRELVVVAALTGLRQGEILAMEWSWIDFSAKLLLVQNSAHFTTKSKRVRVVPLCDEVMTVLLSRRERANDKGGLVFNRRGYALTPSYVTHKFKKAVLKAGLPDRLHWHSLRHSFASWLVQGGVSLFQVGKLLGHSTTSVTEIYAHLVPQDMHGVLGPLHLDN
jgi:site-specific recombinase XerD